MDLSSFPTNRIESTDKVTHHENQDSLRIFSLAYRRYEDLTKKLARSRNHLTFLIRSMKHDVIPHGLRVKSNFQSNRKTNLILKSASHKLMKEQIKHTRYKIDLITSDLKATEKDITSFNDMRKDKILNAIKLTYSRIFKDTKSKQKVKFEKLLEEKRKAQMVDRRTYEELDVERVKKTVINLSSRTFSDEEKQFLSKGLGFAIAPRFVDKLDMVATIETGISKLPDDLKKEVQGKIKTLLDKPCIIRKNMSKRETNFVEDLRRDKSVICLAADKGRSTVILNREEYNNNMKEIFKDEALFEPIKKDPTKKIESDIAEILKPLQEELGKSVKRDLTPKYSKPPHAFGQPKIHKLNNPLRPIISGRNSPSSAMAKFVLTKIKPIGKLLPFRLKDSVEFAEKIREVRLCPGDRLFSFDVVNMYPNIPIPETLILVKAALEKLQDTDDDDAISIETIMKMLTTSLNCNYFQFDQQFYKQTSGLAMGSCLSSIMSDIYMANLEEEIMSNDGFKPKLWIRYVDDVFLIWNGGNDSILKFLDTINNLRPTITFTMEEEIDGSIPFLDYRVIRDKDKLITEVYRKPTHTDQYIHFTSNHHHMFKTGTMKCLLNRAQTHSSTNIAKSREIEYLHKVFKMNGYPDSILNRVFLNHKSRNERKEEPLNTISLQYVPKISEQIKRVLEKVNIRTTFKSGTTMKSILMDVKPNNDLQREKAWVYAIECECEGVYVGETKRPVSVRIKEHRANWRNKKKNPHDSQVSSLLVEHSLASFHDIEWEKICRIWKEEQWGRRRFKEAATMEVLKKEGFKIISQPSYDFDNIWLRTVREQVIRRWKKMKSNS